MRGSFQGLKQRQNVKPRRTLAQRKKSNGNNVSSSHTNNHVNGNSSHAVNDSSKPKGKVSASRNKLLLADGVA